MKQIENQSFDEERAFYGSDGVYLKDCAFDGPDDGESALKESRNIKVERCFCNLRYPFWHTTNLEIMDSELTPLCRAALWYSENIKIVGSKLHGIKALRECSQVQLTGCHIDSPEFGWSVDGIRMKDTKAVSEYFMLRSKNLHFKNVEFKGKYSFQYIENAVFEHCTFDTKDAFWHGKHIVIKNSLVKGEYLAWYSEDVIFEDCKIIGTQPLCYCRGLKLINCQMEEADLAFEKSEVEATITTPVISIKNPYSGCICLPAGCEIIRDDSMARAAVEFM